MPVLNHATPGRLRGKQKVILLESLLEGLHLDGNGVRRREHDIVPMLTSVD